MRRRKGQSIAEYAIVAGIIAIVLTTMGTPFKRTIQKIIKSSADAIGFQSESEQAADPEKGYLNSSETASLVESETTIDEDQSSYVSIVEETSTMETQALSNMGFMEYGD